MRKFCFFSIRYLLIIINIIVIALSSVFVYVSFNAFNQNYELDLLGEPKVMQTYVTYTCAALGLAIALLSFLGLYGAIRKSKSILAIYSALVLLIVIILLALVIYTFTLSTNRADSTANSELDKSFVNSTVVVYNYVDSSDTVTQIIDNIQRSLSCCGVNSPNDWTEYSLHRIPRSCCSDPVESSLPVFKYCAESDHKIGCWKAVVDHFHANLASIRTVLYVLVAFCLICASAAGFLIITLRTCLDMV